MHKYLNAAGFSDFLGESDIYKFIRKTVLRPEFIETELMSGDGTLEREYVYRVAEHVGLAVDTLKLSSGEELISYYYPFFDDPEFKSDSPCGLERYTGSEAFAGLIDEYKLGVSLIFYVAFSLKYKQYLKLNPPADFLGTSLTAFSNEGKVLLPITRSELPDFSSVEKKAEEEKLIDLAMQGDSEAIETLTESDMNRYNEAAERIQKEDLYSVVEQSFMPSGVECDQYSIIGEITKVEGCVNSCTGEDLWLLSLICNEVRLKLCIRKNNLLGEPLCGRRIKARIWLCGNIDLRRAV